MAAPLTTLPTQNFTGKNDSELFGTPKTIRRPEKRAALDRMDMPSDTISIGTKQARSYAQAIGHGLPQEIVSELIEFVKDAHPFPVYWSHEKMPIIYEILGKQGSYERVSRVADLWVEVRPLFLNNYFPADPGYLGQDKHPTCSATCQTRS